MQTAFREVADALAAAPRWATSWAVQLALADAEVRRLELAVLLFHGGVASPHDRLEVEHSATSAQQAVVQLRLARLQNAVLLYRAVGGAPPPN